MTKFMIYFQILVLALCAMFMYLGSAGAGVNFSMVSSVQKQVKDFTELSDRLEAYMMDNADEIMKQNLTEEMTKDLFDMQMEGLNIIGGKKITREAWQRLFRYIKAGEFVDAGQTLELIRAAINSSPVGNTNVMSSRPLTPQEAQEWKEQHGQ